MTPLPWGPTRRSVLHCQASHHTVGVEALKVPGLPSLAPLPAPPQQAGRCAGGAQGGKGLWQVQRSGWVGR